jgi:hypothetical protein
VIMAESKYSPRRIQANEKQRRALELRMAGRSWADIAKAVGYSNHTGAIAAVKVALDKSLQEPAQHYRALTLERLTRVLQVHWPSMLNHDMPATDRVIRVIADIRALLGLDAPIKEDIILTGRVEYDFRAELDARLVTLLERRASAEVASFTDAGTERETSIGVVDMGKEESASTNGSMVHLDATDGTWGRKDT